MPSYHLIFLSLGSILRWSFAIFCITATVCACVPTPLAAEQAAAQVATAVKFTPSPCRFPVPDQQTVQCGNLVVPEDYTKPQGRQIRLHTAIIKSHSDAPAPDPLLILYGGPGAYTLDRIDKTTEHFAGVLATRDLILFDQRGSGYSQPSLNCPELDNFDLTIIDDQLNHEQAFARRLAVYDTCRERLETEGIDLRAYSASAIAADVAGLRHALAYDEWNLYGVSYGARLGLIIMRDYPDGLRSVVLDSVYPLDVDLAAETAVTYDHALSILFRETAVEHPDLEDELYALIDELNAAPIVVPVPDPRGQDLYFMKSFNGSDLLRLTINLAHWPQAIPHVPGLVNDIGNGKLLDLSHLIRPAVGDQLFSEGMNLSANCQEMDPALQQPQQDSAAPIKQQLYNVGAEEMQQCITLCKQWLGDTWSAEPVKAHLPIHSSIPVLILIGAQDAIVPQQWSEQAAAGLANSIIKTFPNTSHGVITANPQAQEMATAFLLDP